MMLSGRIFRSRGAGAWWCAEVPAVGVYTQGKTRKEAEEMLADAVQEVVHRDGFAVTVSRHGGDEVLVEANQPGALAAYLLKYQRETNGLSLADVAKSLGASSRNAYASYERGRTEPTIGKFRELLAAVAPDMALVVEPRAHASSKRKA
jgi:phage terminase large subunit-like protein